MGKAQLEELEKRGMYLSKPHGTSMWPMIRDRRDIVEIRRLEKKPKRYDLVLYVRQKEQGVIHRVIYKEKDGVYVLCGDNCWCKEYVKEENIVGIVTRFYRNGKWYMVDNIGYKMYVHLWTDFFFIRRLICYVRDMAKRVVRKFRK